VTVVQHVQFVSGLTNTQEAEPHLVPLRCVVLLVMATDVLKQGDYHPQVGEIEAWGMTCHKVE